MSQNKNGVRKLNDELYYSFQGMCREFLKDDGRKIVDDVIRTLTKFKIFNKVSSIVGEEQTRKHAYLLSDWGKELIPKDKYVYDKNRRYYFDRETSHKLIKIYTRYKKEDTPFNKWRNIVIEELNCKDV